jgi:hypothetical protein
MAYILAPFILFLCAVINRVRGDKPLGDFHHRHLATLMYAALVYGVTFNWRYTLIFAFTFGISSVLGWAKWQSCGMKAYNEIWLAEDARRPEPFYNAWCELFAPKPFDGDARKKMGQSMEIFTDCHCMSMRMALVFLPMALAMSFLIGDWYVWLAIAVVSSAWMGLSYYLGTWNTWVQSKILPLTTFGWNYGNFPSEFVGGFSWAFPLIYLAYSARL